MIFSILVKQIKNFSITFDLRPRQNISTLQDVLNITENHQNNFDSILIT
jgi:hypothetical protein